jgi:type I restriction enzyme S subunit
MRMWQGAYGIAPEKCMVSPAYVVLHPKENICPKFFVGYFNRSRSLFLFTAFSYGLTSDRLRLYYKDFARIKFAIPDNEEQQKIASFLSAVDEKIQLLTRKKELLEQYKKGVMQQLFSGKLRFKDENGKAFPKWEEKKLQEIASINTGSSNRQDSGLDGEFTFFDRSQDIRTSSIFLFDGEAIIVAGEGQEFAPKHFNGKFDLHQRTYAIMNYKNAIGKYLFYYIHYHRNYFFIQAVGTTVKSLRLPMFQKMNIQVPVIDEQKKIADYLSNIDNKIDSVTKQITQNQTFKKGLLQQMFV